MNKNSLFPIFIISCILYGVIMFAWVMGFTVISIPETAILLIVLYWGIPIFFTLVFGIIIRELVLLGKKD